MANKEVHIGDDWYLDENNDGDLIFYNTRKDEVVKAIDVITGAENKKGNSLNNMSSVAASKGSDFREKGEYAKPLDYHLIPYPKFTFQARGYTRPLYENQSGTVFIQNDDNNLSKSTDYGDTWTEVYTGFSDINLLYKVEATGTLIAVADGNIERSTDGGSTWTTITSTNGTRGSNSVTETPSGYILIAEYSGSTDHIMRSTDDGQNWSDVREQQYQQHFHNVQWDRHGNKLVALEDTTLAADGPHTYVSEDEGATWTEINSADTSYYPNTVSFMFFENYIAWGVDNAEWGNGYIERMPRDDFYNGNWDNYEIVADIGDEMAHYHSVEVGNGVWIGEFRSEAWSDEDSRFSNEIWIVSNDGKDIAHGGSWFYETTSIDSPSPRGAGIPTIPYNSYLEKFIWLAPNTRESTAYSVVRTGPNIHDPYLYLGQMILPNNSAIKGVNTSGGFTKLLSLTDGDTVNLRDYQGNIKIAIDPTGRLYLGGGVGPLRIDSNGLKIKDKIYKTINTITDGDITPSVDNHDIHKTNNTAATTITDFGTTTYGDAQEITVLIEDDNTTIQDQSNGSNIYLQGGIDWSPAQGDVIKLIYDGTNWRETSRSDNT